MSEITRFDTTWEAEEFMRNVSIGPDLKPGLLLQRRECYSDTWINDHKGDTVRGLPQLDFYVLQGESNSVDKERVYDFLRVLFTTPGPLDSDSKKYKYGKKHKLYLNSKEFVSRNFESDLGSTILQLDVSDFKKILSFIESPDGLELKRALKVRNLTNLTTEDPYFEKVRKKHFDDYYS